MRSKTLHIFGPPQEGNVTIQLGINLTARANFILGCSPTRLPSFKPFCKAWHGYKSESDSVFAVFATGQAANQAARGLACPLRRLRDCSEMDSDVVKLRGYEYEES